MKKIPTLFERDWNGDKSRVTSQVAPGCEWVLAGEGQATIKFDGTCCLVREGKLYKRRELRDGEWPPGDFEEVDYDVVTGKSVGWLPVSNAAEDRWHREAWANECAFGSGPPDGTYELIGPKIQGNPEGSEKHVLVRHGDVIDFSAPRDFEGLQAWLAGSNVEGLVFHHPDGRRAKIKGKDFGLKRVRRDNK